jgi:thiamine pyrophosphate-dependent acetolactate synthase large subunit-like protein
VQRYTKPSSPDADAASLQKIARWLIEANFPVIIADRLGRNSNGVVSLQELTEMLAIPVIDRGNAFNFASTHPLNLTGAEADILSEADFVLALEVEDLFGALHRLEMPQRQFMSAVSEKAKIAHISLRDYLVRGWASDYQRLQAVDLSIAADAAVALDQLVVICRGLYRRLDSAKKQSLSERKTKLQQKHNELRARWQNEAENTSKQSPISRAWLALQVWEAVKTESWVLVNGDLGGWAYRLWDWQHPYQYLGRSGGAGLGYGMGASIGAALAHRGTERLCIDLQADGDLLFTPQALWTAAHHNIPLLIIMDNNRSYLNSENHAATVARHRGRAEERKGIGTTLIDPPVDFCQMARSFGIQTEGPIDNPTDLKPALERAVQEVKKGKAVLVDVLTAKGRRVRDTIPQA